MEEAALPPAPGLQDFLAGPDSRLRDLLAFAMAVEAARPLPPDGIEVLRRKAEADLQAHAFRLLHNQVETIRRQAMDEQLSRLPRGMTFSGAITANLVALLIVAVLALGLWWAAPHVVMSLFDHSAQLVARLFARS